VEVGETRRNAVEWKLPVKLKGRSIKQWSDQQWCIEEHMVNRTDDRHTRKMEGQMTKDQVERCL